MHYDFSILYLIGITLRIYTYILIARAIMTWFQGAQNTIVFRLLFVITEPILATVRKVIKPVGGIDFSSLVVVIFLSIASEVFIGAA